MGAKTVVLTGTGQDRVGIVSELAQILYERGCNLLDSSMTLLRGEFALILMIELPEGLPVESLQEDLSSLEKKLGLSMRLRELSQSELAETGAESNSYIVSVYGADRPGIVAGITARLSAAGVNITDVQTKSTGAKGEQGGIFVMILEVSAPEAVTEESLTALLEQSRRQLQVDISIQALESAEL